MQLIGDIVSSGIYEADVEMPLILIAKRKRKIFCVVTKLAAKQHSGSGDLVNLVAPEE
jgi:hypothetical protein